MTDDTLLRFDLPTVRRKKVSTDFGGKLISSDGTLVLLREPQRRLGLAEMLAGRMRDRCNPATVPVATPMAPVACRRDAVTVSPTL